MAQSWVACSLAIGVLSATSVSRGDERALRPAAAKAELIARRAATAGGFSADERAMLLAGETVSRPMTIERDGGRYVGGVSYQVVRASPDQVLAALGSPRELPSLLPRTKSAKLVGVDSRGALIELCQGTALVDATYSVRVRRARDGELRFRLDPTRPHGIHDVWGYLRARPFGRHHSMVTVAVALDVGPGMFRALFEERIQRVILGTPRQIRDYLEPRALARSD